MSVVHTAGEAPSDEATVLSADWLTAVLRRRHPTVVVAGTEVVERRATVATKLRFRVDYAEGGDGLPAALCAKGYFHPSIPGRPDPTEAIFYRDAAPRLGDVRMPACAHAGVDEATGHALVLIEDLVAAGASFLDMAGSYGPEQVAATLDQLAILHAASWGRPDTAFPVAFPPRLVRFADNFASGPLQAQLDDGRATDVPATERQADRVRAALRALDALRPDHVQCVVHGDTHIGNLYRSADGQAGILDWQIVQRGLWALDVAYLLGSVLDPDDRARSERDLLDHYLDRLAAHGVVPPDREDAWWLYRAHLPYGFFLWGITRMVDRPIVEHLTRRLGLAVAEHRSLDLLGV